VALGGLLLADLLLRSRWLVAFYTDAGVFPRSAMAAHYPVLSAFSLHALSGAAWFQGLLFVVAGAVAVALLVGYRTTVATAASLLLLVSLHVRNPAVLNAGDVLLRRLLFWGLLLPLGSRWSVDALDPAGHGSAPANPDGSVVGVPVDGESSTLLASLASAGLLLQVVVVYVVNAVIKHRGSVWGTGEAVRLVFSLESFTTPVGEALAAHPLLLAAVGWLWLVLVSSSVLLVVLTGWRRTLLVAVFAGAHLTMFATLHIGLFPLVSVAALLPFLPAPVWDVLERRFAGRHLPGRPIAAVGGSRADGAGSGSARSWRAGSPVGPAAARELAARARPVVAGLVLAVMLTVNGAALTGAGVPGVEPPGVDRPSFESRVLPWNMFAPSPPDVDGWYVAPARLESGDRVDAWSGGPLTRDRPPDVSATYPSARWRKLLEEYRAREAFDHDHVARYLCRQWNGDGGRELQRVRLVFVAEETRFSGSEPAECRELARYRCDSA
jgi:hypothetical protein